MRYAFCATNKRITDIITDEADIHAEHAAKISLLIEAFGHLRCVKKAVETVGKPERKDETNAPETSRPRTKKKTTKIKDK